MVVETKDRTQRYLNMLGDGSLSPKPFAVRINSSREDSDRPTGAGSSNGYHAKSRRSFSRTKSPMMMRASREPSPQAGVMVQRLSRQDMVKLSADMIVDDDSMLDADDPTWQARLASGGMKESEKFRALSRLMAGKRPEHTLSGFDGASIPPPPSTRLDTGLHSPDYAVDKHPSSMAAAQRRRSVSPYGDIDTFSDVDDGRLEVEVEETNASSEGFRVIPNENYLRLHRHSQRGMMYSKMARNKSADKNGRRTPNRARFVAPEMSNTSTTTNSRARQRSVDVGFNQNLVQAERRQKMDALEGECKSLQEENHKLKLERKRLRGVVARQQDQINVVERENSERVVEHDVDKKLEANLLHILRCVRTTLRPFRREVLPDSVDEMTQQQKIVYYFLRSGNGLGIGSETSYSEKPIPKRDMSMMESTDLSERLNRLDVTDGPRSRPASVRARRGGQTPPPRHRGTGATIRGTHNTRASKYESY